MKDSQHASGRLPKHGTGSQTAIGTDACWLCYRALPEDTRVHNCGSIACPNVNVWPKKPIAD